MNLDENPFEIENEDEQIEAFNEEDISNAEEDNILPIIPKQLVQSQEEQKSIKQELSKSKKASVQKSNKNLKFRKSDFTNTKQILKAKVVNKPNNLVLTNSEYEDIVQRLVDSLPTLERIKNVSHQSSNLEEFQQELDKSCEKLTLRAKIISFQCQKESLIQPQIVTDIYKVELNDLDNFGIKQCKKTCFLMLKYQRKRALRVNEHTQYLIDKIKMVMNKNGEFVLISTNFTVLIEYEMVGNLVEEDSHDIDELSQEDRETFYNDTATGQKGMAIASEPHAEEQASKAMEDKQVRSGKKLWMEERVRMERAGIREIFSGIQPDLLQEEPDLDKVPTLSSSQQILQVAQQVLQRILLQEESARGNHQQQHVNIWSAKQLLSWQIPDNMSSFGSNLQRTRVEAEFLPPPIWLYKYQFVTQRIKEQQVTFCGIVTHVKQGNWDDKNKKTKLTTEETAANNENKDPGRLITSQIDMESIDDKSKFALFIKHTADVDLKQFIQRNFVILIRNAYRKISNNLDIYTQLLLNKTNLKVIGKVVEEVNDFEANNRIMLLKQVPFNQIIRHMIKICGFIVDINFIKIQYRCDICKTDIQNEQVCRNGCVIKNPQLNLQVLCFVQDGTMKASLELKNDKVLKAFNIGEEDQRKFKNYCLKYGTFMNPSSAQNYHYNDIVRCFKKYDTWNQMIFYCKLYCKAQNSLDKKANQINQFQAAANSYQETISKPSFIAQGEKEKEIFLNGEVNNVVIRKQQHGYNQGMPPTGQEKTIKKTNLCLKGIMVDSRLEREAVKNHYNLTRN